MSLQKLGPSNFARCCKICLLSMCLCFIINEVICLFFIPSSKYIFTTYRWSSKLRFCFKNRFLLNLLKYLLISHLFLKKIEQRQPFLEMMIVILVKKSDLPSPILWLLKVHLEWTKVLMVGFSRSRVNYLNVIVFLRIIDGCQGNWLCASNFSHVWWLFFFNDHLKAGLSHIVLDLI